jgi:8-oxo-dGTP diphosphatase
MLNVAVAVIRDTDGRILLTRRRKGTHLEGLWEFPGGKLEPNESIGEALKREILEETGLVILDHRALIGIRHHYPEKSVFLDVHLVTATAGEASGREGQEITWCDLSDIDQYELPAADKPILTSLRLPSLYAISPPSFENETVFLDELRATLDSGVRLVQLRLSGYDNISSIAGNVFDICQSSNAKLMVKDADLAADLGCGLHLRATDLVNLSDRPLPDDQLLAASCHSQEELHRAQQIGVDFVTLSPVLPTASHPEAEPLGWNGFSGLVDSFNLPVFALGGLGADACEDAWRRGAQGVAGIRGLWKTTT